MSRFKGQLPIAYAILPCIEGQRLGRDRFRTISRPRALQRLLQRGDEVGPGLAENIAAHALALPPTRVWGHVVKAYLRGR
jgi:hypothetical protein